MNKKLAIVLIALIGVGLFALPQTVALFAGQHSFVNIDATGNQIDCVKCHGDVKAELGGNVNAMTGTDGPHANFKCEYCHRIEPGSSSGDDAYGLVTYKGTDGTKMLVAVEVIDMEALNLPLVVPSTVTATNFINMTMYPTESGNKMLGKVSISSIQKPAYVGDMTLGELYDMKLVPTYDPATHAPKDTNASTMNGALDVSKITWAAWTTGSRATSNQILLNAGSNAVNPGTSYHAASLVSCLECHGGEEPMGHYSRVADGEVNGGATKCSDCHYGYDTVNPGARWTKLQAGGFGLGIIAGDTGAKEAHTEFALTDDGMTRQTNSYGLSASNGACVACHTHVAVDITYTRPTTYTFDSNMVDGTVGGFTVGGGTTITYSGGN